MEPIPAISKDLTARQRDLRQEGQYLALLNQTPDAIEPRLQLAKLYIKRNRYIKAIKHLEETLAQGSSLPKIYVDLSFCQEQIGQLNEAIQTCLQGISANPEDGDLHLKLGNLYHKKGMDTEAENEYSLYRELSTD